METGRVVIEAPPEPPVPAPVSPLARLMPVAMIVAMGGMTALAYLLLTQKGTPFVYQGDEIGLATVYRVLTQFEAAGLVIKHNFEGGQAMYELDRGGHHDHMVDVDTGKIIEFESPEIEKLQREIAARHGYELEEHSLVLYVRKKRR